MKKVKGRIKEKGIERDKQKEERKRVGWSEEERSKRGKWMRKGWRARSKMEEEVVIVDTPQQNMSPACYPCVT